MSSNGDFMSSAAKVEKYSDLSTLSSSLWTAVIVGRVLGISKTCFPNLLQFLDLSYSIFFLIIIIFERGGMGWRGRAWIPCVGRYVYLQFMWGLVGSYSAKKDAFFWRLERKAQVSSWEGVGEEGSFLANLFWLHMYTPVRVSVDAERPTVKTWLADCSPFQCPRIISDDRYLVWKWRMLLLKIC